MSQPFSPGDQVTVIDGTFAGMEGMVVDLAEAKRIGGQEPSLKPIPGAVWVAMTLFDRQTAVSLFASQVAKKTSNS